MFFDIIMLYYTINTIIIQYGEFCIFYFYTIRMEEKKKKNYLIPVIGALIAVVACVAYIVMKFASQQQQLEDKWSEYDDCGWM